MFNFAYTNYRGNADVNAAERAFEDKVREYGLTYEDVTAENQSTKVREAFAAAVEAAWPNRVVNDPSYEGYIEIFGP